MIDFNQLDKSVLQSMADSGDKILECYRVLRKSNANIVGDLIKSQPEFFEWDHYPKGDVYDNETHAQYYYHAHPPETRLAVYGPEHGHFHTFVRPKGMPKGVKPAKVADYKKPDKANEELSHLVAISMNRQGFPIRMFTTNRWVTGEIWYVAEDVKRILDRFVMDLSYPSWPVNIWITAMMRLFRPQMDTLLIERDRAIEQWQIDKPTVNPYEDRDLEVTSYIDISVDDQIQAVRHALDKHRKK